jgi:hypothetical protein
MTRPDEPTCPLAHTTTVAWLYGEGPEDHLHHVAACEDCAAVAAEHADTLATVGPVLDALRVPQVGAPADPVPAAANRPWLLSAVLAVAVAAVALLLWWPAPSPTVAPAPSVAVVEMTPDALETAWPALDTGVALDDETRVAELDLVDLDVIDDAFDLGVAGLLDDFAALEADLATL